MSSDVVLLIPTLNIGGTESQILKIASQCKRNGITTTIVASRTGTMKNQALSNGISFIEISKNSLSKRSLLNGLMTISTVIRIRPKVLDCYLPESVIYGLFVKLILRRKIFFVVNRRSEIVYRRNFSVFSVLDKVASRVADATTVNSIRLIDIYSKSDKIPINEMYLTENILPASSDSIDYLRVNDPIRIITVANFTHLKGLEYLLEAYAKLIENGYSFEAKLVGSGPLAESIRKYLRLHHLDCVTVHTDVLDPEQLLRGSDVFVLPSLTEGSSNALTEALCFSLACIATNVGGNSELIHDCGVLIEPKSSEAIYAALEKFLNNPDLILNHRKLSKAKFENLTHKRRSLNVRFEIYQRAFTLLK